jgi:hypothetical protein
MEIKDTTSEELVGVTVEEVLSGRTYTIIDEDGFSVCLEEPKSLDNYSKWVSVDKLGKQYQLEESSVSSEVREFFD